MWEYLPPKEKQVQGLVLILNTHYLTWARLSFEGTSPGISPWAKKFGVCSSFIILGVF